MKTLILMADTRHPVHTDIYSAPFYSHASVINFSYARQHGYDFSYYLIDPGASVREQGAAASHDVSSTAHGRIRARAAFECDVCAMRALQLVSPLLKRSQLERQTRATYRYTMMRDAVLLRGTTVAESRSRHTGQDPCRAALLGRGRSGRMSRDSPPRKAATPTGRRRAA